MPSIQKAFKVTLIPTHNQEVLINKTIGCARYVYNRFLALKKELYTSVGKTLNYNTCAEGINIAGKKLCIIEDVITTGGQVLKSAEALRNAGAIADFVICVIWRGSTQDNSLEKAGIQKLPLFDRAELSVWMELS